MGYMCRTPMLEVPILNIKHDLIDRFISHMVSVLKW